MKTQQTTLFPDWLAQHQADPEYDMPARIKEILKLYGRTEGKTCKKCIHLLRHRHSRTYLKCEFSVQSHGPATDWKASWPACGKYQEKKQDE